MISASSHHGRLFIDGAWIDPQGAARLAAFNPATGDAIGDQVDAGADEVDQAVQAARRSFDTGVWRGLAGSERAKILWRVADLIDEEREAISQLEVLNNGMPIAMARFLTTLSAESFRYFAGWCTKIHGQTSEISNPNSQFHAYSLREPVGVAGLIVPWNVPFNSACAKVAVALASGCSAVLKPSEETPFTALKLGDILTRAGVPSGVFNIVTGRGETAGAALVAHPDVDKIGFTGSTEVGKKLIAAVAGNLKRLTLELGGKSPVLVCEDANLDEAVPGAARGIYTNSGQACIAGSRIYVHAKRYDEFVERLGQAASKLRLGSGLDPEADLGPLISQKQLDRVCGLVNRSQTDGAEVVTGGKPVAQAGYFMTPTVITGAQEDAEIMREEIFGPVVTVSRFETTEEALQKANASEYGLAAAVWSRDIKNAHRLAKQLKAGSVWLNCQLATDRSMPFGGYKQSGWGRESGAEGLDAYLQTKSVFASL